MNAEGRCGSRPEFRNSFIPDASRGSPIHRTEQKFGDPCKRKRNDPGGAEPRGQQDGLFAQKAIHDADSGSKEKQEKNGSERIVEEKLFELASRQGS